MYIKMYTARGLAVQPSSSDTQWTFLAPSPPPCQAHPDLCSLRCSHSPQAFFECS